MLNGVPFRRQWRGNGKIIIEVGFEMIVDGHIRPVGEKFITRSGDGLEPVIKHNVKLSCDQSGPQIAD